MGAFKKYPLNPELEEKHPLKDIVDNNFKSLGEKYKFNTGENNFQSYTCTNFTRGEIKLIKSIKTRKASERRVFVNYLLVVCSLLNVVGIVLKVWPILKHFFICAKMLTWKIFGKSFFENFIKRKYK